MKQYKYYCADLEHPEKPQPKIHKDYHRPSLVHVKALFSEEEQTFIEIGDYIDWISNQVTKGNVVRCYWHNLKYDGWEILHYLNDAEIDYDCLISNFGNIYVIKRHINGGTVEFTCSNNVIKTTIEEYGKGLTKRYGIELLKGTWDHTKTGRYSCVEEVPTELLAYCKQDTLILKKMLLEFWEFICEPNGAPKLTVGAIAKQRLKDCVGFKWWNSNIAKQWYPMYPKADRQFMKKASAEKKEEMKAIIQEEVEKWYTLHAQPWFEDYFGGISVGNKKYLGEEITVEKYGIIKKYDINSSYPHKMLQPLPYGAMSYEEWPGVDNITFIEVAVNSVQMKKGYSFPCYPTGYRRIAEDSWLEYGDDIKNSGDTRIFVEEEFNHLLKYYDIDFKLLRRMYFKASAWAAKAVEKYRVMKEEQDRLAASGSNEFNYPKRMFCKFMSNNFYGKTAEKPLKYSKIISKTKDEGTNHYAATCDGGVLDMSSDDAYLPAAMVITARGRMQLADVANSCGDKWLYADTDCVVCIGEIKDLDIDSSRYGAWKDETKGDPIKWFKWLKSKCYGVEHASGFKAVIAGMQYSASKELTKETFKIGTKVRVKQKCRTQGWIYLVWVDKEI